LGIAQASLAVGWAVLGWVLGLALERVIYNLPRDRPVRARPRCAGCDRPIAVLGVPGRTRCESCGKSTGYDRVGWALAGLFALLAIYFGFGAPLAVYSLYAAILLVIAAIDARHRYVYTVVSYPSIVLGVVLSPLLPGVGLSGSLIGLAAGGGSFLGLYMLGRLLYRGAEPMGTGDVTIAALVGAMVGFPRVVSALLIGTMASGLLGLLVILLQRRGRRTFVPYGPGLCAGAVAAFFITP
jgi:leader peptidase (prepilin peptidase)/N-methyltransferase